MTAPIRFGRRLRALPVPVALFHARARFLAWRLGDDAPKGALGPEDLAVLLHVAGDRREVVELGTSKGWTAISLALANKERRVTTYDPAVQHVRERYLGLAPRARHRITFVERMGEAGPVDDPARVQFLFVDSSHEKSATVREYEAWRSALADDAIVVFDDYEHPDFPGVTEAVDELRLTGETAGFLFIHRPSREASDIARST